jgi:hypothetical protein
MGNHWDTVDGRNPAPVDRWVILFSIGFHPSWCRISQPPTIGILNI